jgi:hypothetical protein
VKKNALQELRKKLHIQNWDVSAGTRLSV